MLTPPIPSDRYEKFLRGKLFIVVVVGDELKAKTD